MECKKVNEKYEKVWENEREWEAQKGKESWEGEPKNDQKETG